MLDFANALTAKPPCSASALSRRAVLGARSTPGPSLRLTAAPPCSLLQLVDAAQERGLVGSVDAALLKVSLSRMPAPDRQLLYEGLHDLHAAGEWEALAKALVIAAQ